MALPKPCKRCGKRIPNPGKAQKMCDKCRKARHNEAMDKAAKIYGWRRK